MWYSNSEDTLWVGLELSRLFLYLLVEQDPPEGEIIIEVNTNDPSKN